jgi:dihydroxy-acid dehydratase
VDVPNRVLHLNISEEEKERRKAAWQPPSTRHVRGYPVLYIREVLQADEGCDFRFLKPESSEELIFIEPMVGRS